MHFDHPVRRYRFPRGPSLMRTLANLFQTGTSWIVSGIVMIIVGLAIVVSIVYMSNAERRHVRFSTQSA